MYNGLSQVYGINPERKNPLVYKGLRTKLNRISFCCCDTSFKNLFFPECMLNKGVYEKISWFLYPATKVWQGIMLNPSVSVRPSVRLSVRPSVLTISDR